MRRQLRLKGRVSVLGKLVPKRGKKGQHEKQEDEEGQYKQVQGQGRNPASASSTWRCKHDRSSFGLPPSGPQHRENEGGKSNSESRYQVDEEGVREEAATTPPNIGSDPART